MKIINFTPHDINILDANLKPVEVIERSMKVARLDSDQILIKNSKFTFPMFDTRYSIPYLAKIDKQGNEVERVGFPIQESDIIYIVSGIFRSGFNRSDLWQPGELVRDDEGRPIGCIGLSQ